MGWRRRRFSEAWALLAAGLSILGAVGLDVGYFAARQGGAGQATAMSAQARPISCGTAITIEPARQLTVSKGNGTRCRSEPQAMSTRFSNRMRNAIDVTRGTKCAERLISR